MCEQWRELLAFVNDRADAHYILAAVWYQTLTHLRLRLRDDPSRETSDLFFGQSIHPYGVTEDVEVLLGCGHVVSWLWEVGNGEFRKEQ